MATATENFDVERIQLADSLMQKAKPGRFLIYRNGGREFYYQILNILDGAKLHLEKVSKEDKDSISSDENQIVADLYEWAPNVISISEKNPLEPGQEHLPLAA